MAESTTSSMELKENEPLPLEVKLLSPDNEKTWHQYGALRAKTYLKHGFISEKDINSEGEEFDDYDFRSAHLGIFNSKEELVGCARIIERFYDRYPLPVEEYFNITISQSSAEVSKLIVDSDKITDREQHEMAVLGLFRAATFQTLDKGAEEVYITAERSLVKRLEAIGMKAEILTGPIKFGRANKYAARIIPAEIVEDISARDKIARLKDQPELAGFFRIAERAKGLGKVALDQFFVDSRQFERNRGFISKEEQKVLWESRVAIAGTGGGGGQLAIDLARLGIGGFTLADPEEFSIENINRQFGANYLTIGRNKAEVVAEEILRINPYARVDIFTEGVTEQNVAKFVEGANLVIDETEYTMPEIAVMIGRESRRNNLSVTMVQTVGHGARATNFHPEGPTFEDAMDIDKNASTEDIKKSEPLPLRYWVGQLPEYVNVETFEKVATGELTAPVPSSGISITAGTAAAQAISILLSEVSPSRAEDVIWSPKMGYIDPLETIKQIDPKSLDEFQASFRRAELRTRKGKNPA
jgi:molybdopterin/thiamine biosynthesis adenylyltransferase/N-acyl-L-homoserine lactone synthetase